MKPNAFDTVIAELTEEARLSSRQIGGRTNDELWRAIAKKSSGKYALINITRKAGMVVALSIAVAAAAMYSGFKYYEVRYSVPAVPASAPVPERYQPAERHAVPCADSAVSETVTDRYAPVPPSPAKAMEEPAAPSASVARADSSILEQTPILEDMAIEKNDTVKPVKRTIFKKPDPVTVQETKTKYVKKKRQQ